MKWEIHPAAKLEHDDLITFFAGVDKSLVIQFEEIYLSARYHICQNPFLYNVRWKEVRRVNLTPRFGEYYIAYMVWREKVVILAVAHAKRRPYYWSQRIEDAKRLF